MTIKEIFDTMTKADFLIRFLTKSLIILLLFSCTEEDYDLDSGEVIGKIMPEGTTVIFDRGDKQFSTVSDADGQFILNDLESGIFNISFEKEGYISYKKFGYQFVPGPTVSFVRSPGYLVLKPQNNVQIQSIENMGNQYIRIKGTYVNNDELPDESIKSYRWYIHTTGDVNSENYLKTKTSAIYISDGEYHTSVGLDKEHLNNGNTIYLVGYEVASWYHYYDWDKNQMVYVISEVASNTFSFVLPVDFFNN